MVANSTSATVGEQDSKVTTPASSIETLLWDLDGTLYPIENGYEDHVR